AVGTLAATKVGLIPHTTMLEITEKFPRVARAFWKDTLIEASVFREWLVSIGRRTAYQRVAHLLCELVVRMRAAGLANAQGIPLSITQNEIADALGLSVVHVNRTLQQLRANGLVSLTGRVLSIHDWRLLTR